MSQTPLRCVVAATTLALCVLATNALARDPVGSGVRSGQYSFAPTPALEYANPSSAGARATLWDEPTAVRPAGTTHAPGRPTGTAAQASQWTSPTWYGQADLLVWWTKANQVPALVSDGVLGQPGTNVLHGGGGIDDNYRPGARVTIGTWRDNLQERGIELTWFSLGDGPNSGNYYAQSLGDPPPMNLMRPFYNPVQEQDDVLFIAFPHQVDGDVQVLTNSEMHSLAFSVRQALAGSGGNRFYVVGGYRYLRFRESLTVRTNTTVTDPFGAYAIGTTFNAVDAFGATNDFHGGDIGLSMQFQRGDWTLDVLSKIAFGNMRQKVAIDGVTVITVPDQVPLVGAGSLLALPTNMGTSARNEFAMIPELNLNLSYQLTSRWSVAMGYSLLWITDVARTGNQIDTTVNPTQLPANGGVLLGPARPAPLLGQTSMWAQGVNLGVVFEY